MNGVFWALIFGYYALRFDGDPEQCLASDDSDLRVAKPVSGESYEDVGYRFRLVFSVSFYAALMQIATATLGGVFTTEPMSSALFSINGLMSLIVFFIWIYGFICRFSHSGCVCSADYLPDG